MIINWRKHFCNSGCVVQRYHIDGYGSDYRPELIWYGVTNPFRKGKAVYICPLCENMSICKYVGKTTQSRQYVAEKIADVDAFHITRRGKLLAKKGVQKW